MAIQWADSFARYGTGGGSNTPMRDGLPYNNWLSTCIVDPDPLAPTERCVQINDGIDNNPLTENRIALPAPTAGTVGFCARYWFPSFGSGSGREVIAVWATVAPAVLAYVRTNPNGAISIESGNGTEIASTVAPVISTNSWNHIESTYNGTTGAMEVRLNGITILSGVSTSTGTIAFCHPMRRSGTSIGSNFLVKDLVIWDSSGSRNNTFAGSVVVRRKAPNSDITLGGWVPSTGSTGVPLLAKTTPNDATYLSADDTPPAPMSYTLENLPDDVTSVRGIVSVVRARKIDGGDANLQVSLLSGGDADPGADRPITTTFTYWYDISETDPDTGNAWTPSSFDAADVKIDRTI
jgi:hypothetical protein